MTDNPNYDLVVHNGTIVTVNETFDIIANGEVGVKDGRIERIATADRLGERSSADTVIDAKGGIIMPGLVNTHTHLPMTLFRGLADDLPLDTWLNDHIFPAEAKYVAPEFVQVATWLACAEMALGGTTTCCDGYFYETEVAQALSEFGMRAVAGQGIIDFPAPGIPDPSKNLTVAKAYAESLLDSNSRIYPSLFCHSPYTCSADTLRQAKAIAKELDVLFQIHVAETKTEVDRCRAEHSMSPIEYLDQLNVLDDRTLLVHAVWVDDTDIELIAGRQAAVSHNLESNMKLGAGIAPVESLLSAGITVGLGTDGCASNNNLDLFQEMDVVAKLHKVVSGDPTALAAQTVIRMATIDGARAIGLGERVGSLEVGKEADLIIIDTRQPHLTPMYHPESHIVYAVKASDVDSVVVGGRVVVRHHNILTMAANQILEMAQRASERISADRVSHA